MAFPRRRISRENGKNDCAEEALDAFLCENPQLLKTTSFENALGCGLALVPMVM